MIQNALTKAKYGARLSFGSRLPLLQLRTAPSSRPTLRLNRNAAFKLHLPPPTRTLSQHLFHTTNLGPLDYEYDTIYALSTAPGRAAIAIVRISGPGWWDVSSSYPPNHKMLNAHSRYTKHYAPIKPLLNHEKPLCETCTIHPMPQTSSTLPSSSTSPPQRP